MSAAAATRYGPPRNPLRFGNTCSMLVAWMLAYFATGASVGFLAGLLGIGGGMTLVPVLAVMFSAQQFAPEHTVHLALGTGMASVMFTSTASVRAHHRLGSVNWTLVRRLGPSMVIGTLVATAVSGWVPQRAFVGATQILLGRKPSAGRLLPGGPALVAIGLLIGVVCGLVSAGGAFMTVPFMLFCGISMTTAIGTGAALGVPVAIVGTVGFVFSGCQAGLRSAFAVCLASSSFVRFCSRISSRSSGFKPIRAKGNTIQHTASTKPNMPAAR